MHLITDGHIMPFRIKLPIWPRVRNIAGRVVCKTLHFTWSDETSLKKKKNKESAVISRNPFLAPRDGVNQSHQPACLLFLLHLPHCNTRLVPLGFQGARLPELEGGGHLQSPALILHPSSSTFSVLFLSYFFSTALVAIQHRTRSYWFC